MNIPIRFIDVPQLTKLVEAGTGFLVSSEGSGEFMLLIIFIDRQTFHCVVFRGASCPSWMAHFSTTPRALRCGFIIVRFCCLLFWLYYVKWMFKHHLHILQLSHNTPPSISRFLTPKSDRLSWKPWPKPCCELQSGAYHDNDDAVAMLAAIYTSLHPCSFVAVNSGCLADTRQLRGCSRPVQWRVTSPIQRVIIMLCFLLLHHVAHIML